MCTAIAQAHCLAAAHAPSCKMFCTREVGLSQRPYCVFSRSRHVIAHLYAFSSCPRALFLRKCCPQHHLQRHPFSGPTVIPRSGCWRAARLPSNPTTPSPQIVRHRGKKMPTLGPVGDACCILLLYVVTVYVVICCSIMCICRRFSNAPP